MFKSLIFIFMFNFASATTIKIKFNNFNSSTILNNNEIIYKDMSADLSLKKTACNKDIFEELEKKIGNYSKNIALQIRENSEFDIAIDDSVMKIDKNSKEANWFYNFYKTIFQAKMENKFKCEKEPIN